MGCQTHLLIPLVRGGSARLPRPKEHDLPGRETDFSLRGRADFVLENVLKLFRFRHSAETHDSPSPGQAVNVDKLMSVR